MRVFIVGNANAGKSLMFHRVTRLNVISSNYPGTSVEFSEGVRIINGQEVSFYDLPGTYCLTGVSEDEHIALDLLTKERPDKVIVLANAIVPIPSVILALQLIELGYDVILGLNFMDRAEKRFKIDFNGLQNALDVPVLPLVARTGEGVDKLLDFMSTDHRVAQRTTNYDPELEKAIESIENEIRPLSLGFSSRGLAIKGLEGNRYFIGFLPDKVMEKARSVCSRYEHEQKLHSCIARGKARGIVGNSLISF